MCHGDYNFVISEEYPWFRLPFLIVLSSRRQHPLFENIVHRHEEKNQLPGMFYNGFGELWIPGYG